MRRLINILILFGLTFPVVAQDDTHIVDSLRNILPTQEGREKVLTMIELTWEFYDISFDDGISWGEKAIKEAHDLGFVDLEADASYALGMQYGYHADLDLAKIYLKKAYTLHKTVGNDDISFEDLWNQAYFEQVWGDVDTAFQDYEKVLTFAEQRHDSLAMAQTYANMAVIHYHWQDFKKAEIGFKKSCHLYQLINSPIWMARMEANLANLYMEWEKYAEARNLFRIVIPQLESIDDYGWLLRAYKNYGQLFMKDHIDYDSASYYFEKAMACTTQEALTRNSSNAMANEKVDLLVEMGNVALYKQDEKTAVDYFEEALALAQNNKYQIGVIQAAHALGQLYAIQGKARLSLHYLEIYALAVQRSGVTLLDAQTKKPLILDYARLGRYEDMERELDALDEMRAALMRENADIYERYEVLQDEATGLLEQHESQNKQIQTLQTQRNHYRLAFFGLLAIMLSAMVLFVSYKIVRKNRAKIEKG